jgi:GTP diphosphokinase / guanosine-3',5'-bis(diphosphate) 3'-diphosphatase
VIITSVSPSTGSQFSMLPPENATGNWVKVVQRVPVRLQLTHVDAAFLVQAELSANVTVDTRSHDPKLTGAFGRRVAGIVEEVTDTKWLQKATRKKLQVARASRSSKAAKLVKLADKICNLRDLLASPPAGWSIERIREYFDWAKSVIDRARGTNARLEKRFDQLYGMRP